MKFIFKNLPKTKIALLSILVFSLLPISISSGIAATFDNPLGETSDIYTLVMKILDFLIVLAIPLSAILIVYAGLLYITSAGNEEKLKTAQKTLIWALIGFAVVLIAKGVPTIIEEFLSGKEESPAEAPAEAPEAPTESAEPDNGGASEPAETPTETPAESVETGAYKDCEFYLITGTSACVTKTWSGIENKPKENFCEDDSFCQKFIYKACKKNIETGEPFCQASVWYGTTPKPDNECETNSECQIPVEETGFSEKTGTYKICRDSNWSWLSGNKTLYCKEATWTGENPGDECPVLDEVCQGGTGAF